MVDVVVVLPPADAEAADEVCNYDADRAVEVKRVSYSHVAGVVDGEDELVPKKTQRQGRKEEDLLLEEVDEGREEGKVANGFNGVGAIRAVEETSGSELLLESSVFGDDLVL